MRIFLAASVPCSEIVRITAEALKWAGHMVQFPLDSPDAVISFDSRSSSLAARAFPGVPVAEYLLYGRIIPEPVPDRKTLIVFPYARPEWENTVEYGFRTAVVTPPLDELKTGFSRSESSMDAVLPGPFNSGSGHRTFFKAMALLPWEMKVIVSGEEGDCTRDDLEEMAVCEGVESRVTFSCSSSSGEVFAGAVPDLSGAFSCEIAGSVMASGIPLLASSSGCHLNLVKDGVTGLLHAPGNHRQLAGQINHLMHNRGLAGYLSKNAAAYCSETLSLEAAGKRWTAALEQLRSL